MIIVKMKFNWTTKQAIEETAEVYGYKLRQTLNASVLEWNIWVLFPTSAPNSSFLLRQTLEGFSEGPRNWLLVTHILTEILAPAFSLAEH